MENFQNNENIKHDNLEILNKIQYIKIDYNNEYHINILEKFYNELYIKEFPNVDEIDSLESIITQLKYSKEIKNYHYYCIISICENIIIGGIIGDYFGDCNSGLIEFIVINPKMRLMYLGSNLISLLIKLFNGDARKYNDNFENIEYCYLECDNPNKVDAHEKEVCISKRKFWDKKRLINWILIIFKHL